MKFIASLFAASLFLFALSIPAPGQDSKALFDEAVGDFQSERYEPAAAKLREVVKLSPKNAEAYFYLGSSLAKIGEDEAAVAALEEAVRLKSDYMEAHFELGKVYFARGEYETSLPYLEKTTKLNNKFVPAMVLLGDNYRRLGRFNDAVVPLQRAIGFDEKSAGAYYGLGLTYIGLNNRIAARQQYQKLKTLDKDLAEKLLEAINK